MLRYERARDPWSVEEEAALLAPPLLQLAVTTRSEVTTLSRILLEQHADGIRRSRAKTWLKALPGKHAAALLHVAEQSEGNVVDGGGSGGGGSNGKQVMVAVQMVREVVGIWTKEFVTVLLELGSDPAALDQQGENAVHVAALYGNTAAVATILDQNGAGRGASAGAEGGGTAISVHTRERAELSNTCSKSEVYWPAAHHISCNHVHYCRKSSVCTDSIHPTLRPLFLSLLLLLLLLSAAHARANAAQRSRPLQRCHCVRCHS